MNIRILVYFYPNTDDYTSLDIEFDWPEPNDIKFECHDVECDIDLYGVEYLTEKDKRDFYKSVFHHFFKKEIKVPYKLLERDVPLKYYIRYN